MLMYGTDTFWPVSAEEYREQYLQPTLGLFETATTLGHIVGEGVPPTRSTDMIFYGNAYEHWQNAIKESPRARDRARAHRGAERPQGTPALTGGPGQR
jgi:hypothetical protein